MKRRPNNSFVYQSSASCSGRLANGKEAEVNYRRLELDPRRRRGVADDMGNDSTTISGVSTTVYAVLIRAQELAPRLGNRAPRDK